MDIKMFFKERYLFKGTSCYPLTPCSQERKDGKDKSIVNKND